MSGDFCPGKKQMQSRLNLAEEDSFKPTIHFEKPALETQSKSLEKKMEIFRQEQAGL